MKLEEPRYVGNVDKRGLNRFFRQRFETAYPINFELIQVIVI